jgi:hypothetical protein
MSQTPNRMEILVRGILVGGSLGALAGFLDVMDFHRAVGLGMLVGALAALAHGKDRKGGKDKT